MDYTKTLSAVFYAKDDLRLEQVPTAPMGDDDVMIQIKAVGVCGSDVHYFKEGAIGPYVPPKGHILGHESAGVVVAVGKNVKDKKIGDRVAIEPGYSCRKCAFCKSGKYNLCKDMMFMSHPDPQQKGAMTQYIPWPADFTYLLPENVSFEEGVMVEPLSVALQAVKNGKVKAGDVVVIYGCGTIGLNLLLACQAYGCSKIIMIEKTAYRVEWAKKLGADIVIDNSQNKDYIKDVFAATNGMGADVVIDASGSDEAYANCTGLCKRGGMVTLVGMSAEKIFPVNVFEIIDRELNFSSVFRYDNTYRLGLELIASGRLDVKKLITHRMKLEDAERAMNMVFHQEDNVLKVILAIDD